MKSIICPISKTGVTFKYFFFLSIITEWNKLDRDIGNSDSLNNFKLALLKFNRPVANSVFEIDNPYDLKLLIRLRLGLSHFHYHKFRQNLRDCINPICACGLEIETTTFFPPLPPIPICKTIPLNQY